MNIINSLRQFRIGEYAIFDFVISFLGIFLLAPLLSKLFRKVGIEIPKQNWLFFVLPLAIVAHLIFGPITPMTGNFIDPNGHYILKMVVIGSFILGFRNIKRVVKV